MNKPALATALLTLAPICLAAQASLALPWKPVNGLACTVNGIAVQGPRLFAAAECGLFETSNGGQNWVQATDKQAMFVAASPGRGRAVARMKNALG